MRDWRSFSGSSTLLLAALSLLAASTACGSPKPPAEPSGSAEESPKWEGSAAPSEEPKPKSAGSHVNEAPRRRTDVYDKEATDVVLGRAARQVKENCGAAKDDNGKAVGPWGKATLQVALGNNGHSKGVTVPPPFQGKPTGNCVEKAFTNLTFPPWGGPDVTVDWEVELVNPASRTDKK